MPDDKKKIIEAEESVKKSESKEISEDELEAVTAGEGLNPPRVDLHPYDPDVISKMQV